MFKKVICSLNLCEGQPVLFNYGIFFPREYCILDNTTSYSNTGKLALWFCFSSRLLFYSFPQNKPVLFTLCEYLYYCILKLYVEDMVKRKKMNINVNFASTCLSDLLALLIFILHSAGFCYAAMRLYYLVFCSLKRKKYHVLPCIMCSHYNVNPRFCVHQTQDYYIYYYTHDMQSLYPCIMSILIFPSKIWAKSEHYTQQNIVILVYLLLHFNNYQPVTNFLSSGSSLIPSPLYFLKKI